MKAFLQDTAGESADGVNRVNECSKKCFRGLMLEMFFRKCSKALLKVLWNKSLAKAVHEYSDKTFVFKMILSENILNWIYGS